MPTQSTRRDGYLKIAIDDKFEQNKSVKQVTNEQKHGESGVLDPSL